MKLLKIVTVSTLLFPLSGCYQIACSLLTQEGTHNCWGEGYDGDH